MKRVLFASLLAAGAALCAADAAKPAPMDAEKEARRAEARQRMMEKTGGLIKVDGKGSVAFIDLQTRLPAEAIGLRAALLAKMLRAEVRALSADDKAFRIETAAKHLEKTGATAAVLVVDSPGLPMSLLALEQRWAAVNVAALAEDKPDAATLTRRVNKMLTRQAAVLLGAYSSTAKTTPLVAVSSLKDLDALDYDMPTMDSLMSILRFLPQMGITQTKMTTYKKACLEGWAPAPTNEFQRVIFEQVKSDKERGPSKPLTIVPPKK